MTRIVQAKETFCSLSKKYATTLEQNIEIQGGFTLRVDLWVNCGLGGLVSGFKRRLY